MKKSLYLIVLLLLILEACSLTPTTPPTPTSTEPSVVITETPTEAPVEDTASPIVSSSRYQRTRPSERASVYQTTVTPASACWR